MSRKARGVAIEGDADNRSRGVGAVFHRAGPHAGRIVEVSAAVCRRRMHMDDGLAPIELFHHRPIGWIAEPTIAITGEEAYAVCFQGVDACAISFKSAVDIRKRQGGKEAESSRMVRDQLRSIVVARARQDDSSPPCRRTRVRDW